jgi:metallo-beta-lactamase family protein
LYLEKHVKECINKFVSVKFDKEYIINPSIKLTFIQAGHLLGAASIRVDIKDNNKSTSIGFSGDLGRKNSKLINDTQIFKGINYLVTEGTYGGRKHLVERNAEDELLDYISNACVKNRGKLIIPAFSVGRTQSIVFTINQLKKQNLIPSELRVFVDSPLAIKSTSVYENNFDLMNKEAQDFFNEHGSLFKFEGVKYLEDKNQHAEITNYYQPCIIVSAAGMVEGGRIQEHINNNIENPNATILIAGFCSEGTLGYRLLQGLSTIRIKNREKRVYAKIARTDVYSSHPDHDEIISYIHTTSKENELTRVFLIHGEEPQLNAIKEDLSTKGLNQITIPDYLQEFNL